MAGSGLGSAVARNVPGSGSVDAQGLLIISDFLLLPIDLRVTVRGDRVGVDRRPVDVRLIRRDRRPASGHDKGEEPRMAEPRPAGES
jgi:hypothetical protein